MLNPRFCSRWVHKEGSVWNWEPKAQCPLGKDKLEGLCAAGGDDMETCLPRPWCGVEGNKNSLLRIPNHRQPAKEFAACVYTVRGSEIFRQRLFFTIVLEPWYSGCLPALYPKHCPLFTFLPSAWKPGKSETGSSFNPQVLEFIVGFKILHYCRPYLRPLGKQRTTVAFTIFGLHLLDTSGGRDWGRERNEESFIMP